MTQTRFLPLFLGAALVATVPLAAKAQSTPDVRRYEPGVASAGVPVTPPRAPRPAAAASTPDVRSYEAGVASAGVPVTDPNRVWAPTADGSTASAGVSMAPPPAAMAQAPAAR
ncbi:hypothetical protein [Roseomonas sp. BN140053]|uniref:hypothetical protein n=1 Tax=Roseomonas sp. BN140053 TaxID=3391898 RepID=UPI0039E8E61E